jgi:hypothetical protein
VFSLQEGVWAVNVSPLGNPQITPIKNFVIYRDPSICTRGLIFLDIVMPKGVYDALIVCGSS